MVWVLSSYFSKYIIWTFSSFINVCSARILYFSVQTSQISEIPDAALYHTVGIVYVWKIITVLVNTHKHHFKLNWLKFVCIGWDSTEGYKYIFTKAYGEVSIDPELQDSLKFHGYNIVWFKTNTISNVKLTIDPGRCWMFLFFILKRPVLLLVFWSHIFFRIWDSPSSSWIAHRFILLGLIVYLLTFNYFITINNFLGTKSLIIFN